MVTSGSDPEKTKQRIELRWALRDWIAAAVLFVATACVILWQNAHVAVLWDLGYVLDSAARFAAGQIPYRDFPIVHPPLTFMVQAAIMRFTGHVYFHHVMYVAAMGGMGTVLAWRIALTTLRRRAKAAWAMSLLLAAPLTVVGIYCVFPFPSYDCDCAFWILVAVWALQRVGVGTRLGRGREFGRGFLAGAALFVPVLVKQNMGLPFFVIAIIGVATLISIHNIWQMKDNNISYEYFSLIMVLIGAGAALLAGAVGLELTAGIGNYLHWTVQFAGERRMPGLSAMLGVYLYPSLAWMLPCVVAGLAVLGVFHGKRWAQVAGFLMVAAPFVFPVIALVLYDDADERGDSLLAIWPVMLVMAGVVALLNVYRHRRALGVRDLLPFVVLAAVNGTMMSQQLWGSTYAIWPLLILLLAEMIACLDGLADTFGARWFAPAMVGLVSTMLLVCGGFYTASEERLSYVKFPDGPAVRSAFSSLKGMATPGPYIPEFDELLHYAAANIPFNDGIILIPGDEPFFFASGRAPHFPVTLFDPTTDPYTPDETATLVRTENIRWLVVKRDLQINADPTPQRVELMQALMSEFTPAAKLGGYDVYRR